MEEERIFLVNGVKIQIVMKKRGNKYLDREGQNMNFEKVKKHVNKALKQFLKKDIFLLRNNLNERTISHKLAEYLQEEFPDWNVDREYNRKFGKIKKLRPKTIQSEDTDAKTVYPDIIIHHRNSDDNLLIIEIKKNASKSDKENDIDKITRFIEEYKYSYGLFIDFITIGAKKGRIKPKQWFS